MSVKNEVSTIVRNSVYECNKVIDGLDTIVHNLGTAFEISEKVNDTMATSIYEALELVEKARKSIRKTNKILDTVKSKL